MMAGRNGVLNTSGELKDAAAVFRESLSNKLENTKSQNQIEQNKKITLKDELFKYDSVKPPLSKLDDSFNSPKFREEPGMVASNHGKNSTFLPKISKKTPMFSNRERFSFTNENSGRCPSRYDEVENEAHYSFMIRS
jgi:hypothetical protein